MTNDDYLKCKTCRFCIHSGEVWACSLTGSSTTKEGTCGRYRPGCCENCTGLVFTEGLPFCIVHDNATDTLNVCSDYDPCGRRSL
ncbi:MAG: hypothetical protein LBM39_00615 [Candidatus Methanoplasma sp.]|nr:hypothetical protein [Candidatus Methanoplasma sp.]